MTLTVNAWFVWAVAALALVGACTVLYLAGGVLEGLGDWWRDRRESLGDEDIAECCDDCGANLVRGEDHSSACIYLEDLPGPILLPPERSREELGFPGPQPAYPARRRNPLGLCPECRQVADHDPAECWENWLEHARQSELRERWAPAWEAEARSAYQALDLDYPSGLLARVREAGQ